MARCEDDHLYGTSLAVEQAGDQYRGIRPVVLLGAFEILQVDRPVAAFGLRRQQGAEAGVVVESRQAAPDDARTVVDQRSDTAVADDAKLKAGAVGLLRRVGHGWGLRV